MGFEHAFFEQLNIWTSVETRLPLRPPTHPCPFLTRLKLAARAHPHGPWNVSPTEQTWAKVNIVARWICSISSLHAHSLNPYSLNKYWTDQNFTFPRCALGLIRIWRYCIQCHVLVQLKFRVALRWSSHENLQVLLMLFSKRVRSSAFSKHVLPRSTMVPVL